MESPYYQSNDPPETPRETIGKRLIAKLLFPPRELSENDIRKHISVTLNVHRAPSVDSIRKVKIK